jgi:hypothetical protein
VQLPPYALIEYDVNEPELPPVWALCHDAEGLFADRPLPVRERYELLGCAPERDLLNAVVQARSEGPAPLCFLALERMCASWGTVPVPVISPSRMCRSRRPRASSRPTIRNARPCRRDSGCSVRTMSPGIRPGTWRVCGRPPTSWTSRLSGCSAAPRAARCAMRWGRDGRTWGMPRSCCSTASAEMSRPRRAGTPRGGSRPHGAADSSTSRLSHGPSARRSRRARCGTSGPTIVPRLHIPNVRLA